MEREETQTERDTRRICISKQQRPEEGVWFLGVEITGGYEVPARTLGTKVVASGRTASTLNR